jgi:hypothetical protein
VASFDLIMESFPDLVLPAYAMTDAVRPVAELLRLLGLN